MCVYVNERQCVWHWSSLASQKMLLNEAISISSTPIAIITHCALRHWKLLRWTNNQIRPCSCCCCEVRRTIHAALSHTIMTVYQNVKSRLRCDVDIIVVPGYRSCDKPELHQNTSYSVGIERTWRLNCSDKFPPVTFNTPPRCCNIYYWRYRNQCENFSYVRCSYLFLSLLGNSNRLSHRRTKITEHFAYILYPAQH